MEWKDVVGFEGIYQVSNTGIVRSVDRRRRVSDSMGRNYEVVNRGRVLATRLHQFGYLIVTLSKENIPYTRTVHRLVAKAFLPFRGESFVVRHLDGNCLNNNVENLAYGTQKENMADAARHNTIEKAERRYNAKLTTETVIQIRERKAAGERNVNLAKEYGLTEVYIHHLVTGEKWSSAGGPITECRISNILTPEQRIEVANCRNNGESFGKIAKRFGVSITQVINIIKGKNEN